MSRARWPLMVMLCCLAVSLATARATRADTVWLRSGNTNALARPNMKVEKLENGQLFFRSTQSDLLTQRPVEDVVRILADGETTFNAAEEAFAAGEWDKAAAGYQRSLSSPKQWIKDRSALRLIAAAEKSGKFSTAVAGWAALLARDPALASEHKPQVPTATKPGSLDAAVAELDKSINDTRLPQETKQTLLTYQMELARANGDVKRAQSIATKLGGTPGVAQNSEVALQLASLALEQKQYDQVLKTIEQAAPTITDPQQQVEALYCLAEARSGLAGNEPAALKDVALAYMRVVARAKAARASSPRVADALLKTAAIQEKIGAAKEALLLYQQVSDEFKGTDAGTRAAQAAERLGKSTKAES